LAALAAVPILPDLSAALAVDRTLLDLLAALAAVRTPLDPLAALAAVPIHPDLSAALESDAATNPGCCGKETDGALTVDKSREAVIKFAMM
jgi:hypothetical protein